MTMFRVLRVFQRFVYTYSKSWEAPLTPALRKKIEAYWKHEFSKKPRKFVSETQGEAEFKKKYVLSMFPYPSGNLHMGHVRVYTISDIMARFFHMQGYQVIHPIGWDAFGLPAENAAIDHGRVPHEWTKANIKQMKQQLVDLGYWFDWNREFATCDPAYYRWTQKIFLDLYKAGLTYKQEALVNWDPVDCTVLANEQVDDNGISWRSGATVEKRFLKQWLIKTTRFSDSLLNGLSSLRGEECKEMVNAQRGWIGNCSGYMFDMDIIAHKFISGLESHFLDRITLWIENPEHIQQIAFVGVKSGTRFDKLEYYKGEKSGDFQMLNIQAVNPLSGKPVEMIVCDELPYIGKMDCYLVIPSSCEEDAELCKELGLPSIDITPSRDISREEAINLLQTRGYGGFHGSPDVQDWLISRQRYWGTPIPVIHCSSCGTVPVPEEDLPVLLPDISKTYIKGGFSLAHMKDWIRCSCPRCGKEAQRETDTMDTFVDSSWYFLRYIDPHNSTKPFDSDLINKFMPVDVYVGGLEHAIRHLYYSRVVQHFLHNEGLVKELEPFQQFCFVGLVKADCYQSKISKQYLTRDQVDFTVSPPVEKETHAPVIVSCEKMSKSKLNGINPQEVIEELGIDMTRLMLIAWYKPSRNLSWPLEDQKKMVFAWLHKLWKFTGEILLLHSGDKMNHGAAPDAHLPDTVEQVHKMQNAYIALVTNYYLDINLAKAFFEITNFTRKMKALPHVVRRTEEFEKAFATLIIMSAPLAPYLMAEVWSAFCCVASSPAVNKDIHLLDQPWPEVEQDMPLEMTVKVNHVRKCIIPVIRRDHDHLTEETALRLASVDHHVQKALSNATISNTSLRMRPGVASVFDIFL